MKRLVVLLAFIAVSAMLAGAQKQAEPTVQPGHDHSQMQAQHTKHTQNMCQQMMGDHVAEMKATSKMLAANLAQMKATLPLISDINERSRWQSNIAMWQALADHFNYMAGHAENMQATGMGCGVMMGHDMGDHAAHERSTPPTPPSPQ